MSEKEGVHTERQALPTSEPGCASALRQAEVDRMNAEANAFAMELLMPAEWIRRDAAGIGLMDEAAVKRLAKRYRVDPTVMAMRIGQVMQ